MAQAGPPSNPHESNIRAFPFFHLIPLDFSLDDLSALTSAQVAASFFHPDYTPEKHKRQLTKAWRARREKKRDEILNQNQLVGTRAPLDERRKDPFVGFEQIDFAWSIPADLNTLNSAQLAVLPFHPAYNAEVNDRAWNASEIFSSRRERDVQKGYAISVPEDAPLPLPTPARPQEAAKRSSPPLPLSNDVTSSGAMDSLFDTTGRVANPPTYVRQPTIFPSPATVHPAPPASNSTTSKARSKRPLSPDWRPFIPTERQASLAQRAGSVAPSSKTNQPKLIKKTVTYSAKSKSKTSVSSTTRPSASSSSTKSKFKSNHTPSKSTTKKQYHPTSKSAPFPRRPPPQRWDEIWTPAPTNPPETAVKISSTLEPRFKRSDEEANATVWSNFLIKVAKEYWKEMAEEEKKEARRLEDQKVGEIPFSAGLEARMKMSEEEGQEKAEQLENGQMDRGMDLDEGLEEEKDRVVVVEHEVVENLRDVETRTPSTSPIEDVKMEEEDETMDGPMSEGTPMELSAGENDASPDPPIFNIQSTPDIVDNESEDVLTIEYCGERNPDLPDSLVADPLAPLETSVDKQPGPPDSLPIFPTSSPPLDHSASPTLVEVEDPSVEVENSSSAAGASPIPQAAEPTPPPSEETPPLVVVKTEPVAELLHPTSPPPSFSLTIRGISAQGIARVSTSPSTSVPTPPGLPKKPSTPTPTSLPLRSSKVSRPSALEFAELPVELNSVVLGGVASLPRRPTSANQSIKSHGVETISQSSRRSSPPIWTSSTSTSPTLPASLQKETHVASPSTSSAPPPTTATKSAMPERSSPLPIKSSDSRPSLPPTGPRLSENRPRLSERDVDIDGQVPPQLIDSWEVLHLAGIPSHMGTRAVWSLLAPPHLPQPLGIKLIVPKPDARGRNRGSLCWMAYATHAEGEKARQGLSGKKYPEGDRPLLLTWAIKKANTLWYWKDMSAAYRDSIKSRKLTPSPASLNLTDSLRCRPESQGRPVSSATAPDPSPVPVSRPVKPRSWSPVPGDRPISPVPRQWGSSKKDDSPPVVRGRSRSPSPRPRNDASPSSRRSSRVSLSQPDRPLPNPPPTSKASLPTPPQPPVQRPPPNDPIPANVSARLFDLAVLNIPPATLTRQAREFFPSSVVGIALPENTRSPSWLAFIDAADRALVADTTVNGRHFPSARNPMRPEFRLRPSPWTWGDLSDDFVRDIQAGKFVGSDAPLPAPPASVERKKRSWSPDIEDQGARGRNLRSLSPEPRRRTSTSSYPMDKSSKSRDWAPVTTRRGRSPSPPLSSRTTPASTKTWFPSDTRGAAPQPPAKYQRASYGGPPIVPSAPISPASTSFAPSRDELLALLNTNLFAPAPTPIVHPSPLAAPPSQDQLSSLLASLANPVSAPLNLGAGPQGSAYDPNERIDLASKVIIPAERVREIPENMNNWGGKDWEKDRRG